MNGVHVFKGGAEMIGVSVRVDKRWQRMIAGNRFSRLLTRAKLSFATRRLKFCVFRFWVITPPTTMSKSIFFWFLFFWNLNLHIHVRGERQSIVGCRQRFGDDSVLCGRRREELMRVFLCVAEDWPTDSGETGGVNILLESRVCVSGASNKTGWVPGIATILTAMTACRTTSDHLQKDMADISWSTLTRSRTPGESSFKAQLSRGAGVVSKANSRRCWPPIRDTWVPSH